MSCEFAVNLDAEEVSYCALAATKSPSHICLLSRMNTHVWTVDTLTETPLALKLLRTDFTLAMIAAALSFTSFLRKDYQDRSGTQKRR